MSVDVVAVVVMVVEVGVVVVFELAELISSKAANGEITGVYGPDLKVTRGLRC